MQDKSDALVVTANDVDIDRVLVLSSAHITKADAERLQMETAKYGEDPSNCVLISTYSYGWFIWVGDVLGLPIFHAMSTNFQALMSLTLKFECQWLRLDRDAPHYRGLEIFDWEKTE